MVDVEHRALRALEQDARAARLQLAQPQPGRLGEGQDLAAPSRAARATSSSPSTSGRPKPRRSALWWQQQVVDLGGQRLGVGQVADPDRAAGRPCPRRPGRCRGRWCRSCRCRCCSPARALAGTVELAVQRQDQGRVLGDPQAVRADRDALAADRLDLVEQRPGVDHDAVADDRELALAHDARGQQASL